MYKEVEFYFLNWVQLFYDFSKVVPSGSTQGKVCHILGKGTFYLLSWQ